MKGKDGADGADGAALTFANSGEVYVYDHEAGEGCQVCR